MGTVIISIREAYGQPRAYPVNDTAKSFATLVGQKTLSSEHLRLIKALGFSVEIQQPTFDL